MTQSFDDEFNKVSGINFPLGSGYYSAFKCGYEAGAQSKQAEIDELRKRIDEALSLLCKLQYSSGERINREASNVLKGTTNEQ